MNKDSINLPAIPLRGITIFPNMIIHFDVGREKSISALEESMLKDSKIFLVSQIDPEIEDPKRNEIYSIGTICKIKQILKLPKGVTRVLVEGVERAAIIDLIDDKKFMEVVEEKIDDELNLKDENEDIKIYKGQGGFVAFYGKQGNHHYVLKYETPYLKEGFKMMAIGVFLVSAMYIGQNYFYFNKKRYERMFSLKA